MQLTELRALLVSGSSGRRAPVVIVDGDVGIGKTRMALDISADFPGSVVLPPAVGARPHDLADLVVDRPTVLVVEDAHRSGRDLTGVAWLLRDAAYNQVRVVLTARRGFTEKIIERVHAVRCVAVLPDSTEFDDETGFQQVGDGRVDLVGVGRQRADRRGEPAQAYSIGVATPRAHRDGRQYRTTYVGVRGIAGAKSWAGF